MGPDEVCGFCFKGTGEPWESLEPERGDVIRFTVSSKLF